MATIIGYSLMIVTIVISGWMLVLHVSRMGARRITGLNDGDIAKRYFLLLLGQAKRTMVVYDDGNEVQDSFYSDQEVLNAIDTKLRENPRFVMKCLFNCPVPYSLNTKFASETRVNLRTTGLGKDRPRDTHMKVIDNGRMAYFTQHDFGSTVRQYELVDCLTVKPWALNGVVKRELGDCLKLFEQRFSQASPT